MLSCTGRDFNAASVVGCACTLEDTSYLAELAANLLNHLLGCTTYGLHSHTAEQEGGHSTDEGTNQNLRIHEVYLEEVHEVGDVGISSRDNLALQILHRYIGASHRYLNLLDIRCQQSKCGESGRTDGKTLTCGCCGVAKSIEGIGAVANLLAKTRHFGVTAGIVGNWSISIGGQSDAKC